LRQKADIQRIVDFLNVCEKVDQYDFYCTTSVLKHEYAEPGFDPYKNVQLWFDDTDQLIVRAELWLPESANETAETDGYLSIRVHPDARWKGLE
jgi:mycothiol synthase